MAFSFTEENFQKEVLKSPLPVLVDFWASWCAPCMMAGPVIEELARDYEGKLKVGKVNVDQNQVLAQKHQVMSIPTVIIFQKGKEVKRVVGFPGKAGYEEAVKAVLKS